MPPAHPATVHFPIAFLSLAYGLDILHTVKPNLPGSVTSYIPADFDLTRASYYLLSLGLLTAIPAVVTGGQQAVKLFARQGMYEADGKTLKIKTKATIAHAVVNDIALAASAYVWYAKHQAANSTIVGKLGLSSEALYAPALWMVAAQVITFGLLLFGASIGGALTYQYGVGFSAVGTSNNVGKKSK
ncbi:hypothetical protein AMS68_004260 [Peltaster fructicola]|uniref:DUF2231 domain-containing protein n=1 Tax=Peltaster fructicola TaxID=286661 RepID=A0A6H0XVG8_9PEZI|nr:hypothetical protein AMS68_004260 [Peltaster fructicola]